MSDSSSSNPSYEEIAAVRRRLAELDSFFEHSQMLLCIANRDGHFVRLNPAWEKTLGWSTTELVGRHFLEFVHPDDRAATRVAAARFFAGGTESAFENRYVRKDGSYLHVRWFAGAPDEEGRTHTFGQDITEQRKAEERARIYEDTILSSLTGILVLHLEEPGNPASLRIVIANDAAGTFVGFDVKREAGRMAVDVFPQNVESGLAAIYMGLAEAGGARDIGEVTYRDGRVEGVFAIRAFGLPERRVCLNFENITERKRAEEALRQGLVQAEVIRAQAAALAELSTPLIPISDDVVVMPLIGTVDSIRAAQVLDTLLSGVANRRARVAIVDITGVAVVDTQVANTILHAARAVRLLGAQVMLTGIRPEVARTLIGLDIDLGGIITHGSLQAGIAAAFGWRGA